MGAGMTAQHIHREGNEIKRSPGLRRQLRVRRRTLEEVGMLRAGVEHRTQQRDVHPVYCARVGLDHFLDGFLVEQLLQFCFPCSYTTLTDLLVVHLRPLPPRTLAQPTDGNSPMKALGLRHGCMPSAANPERRLSLPIHRCIRAPHRSSATARQNGMSPRRPKCAADAQRSTTRSRQRRNRSCSRPRP